MTNLSYWEYRSFLEEADAVVVGGGLVGLTAAIYLRQHRPQARVLVLERDVLPNGASTKNAGFACFGSVSELHAQEQRGGTARPCWPWCKPVGKACAACASCSAMSPWATGPKAATSCSGPADMDLAASSRGLLGYYNELLSLHYRPNNSVPRRLGPHCRAGTGPDGGNAGKHRRGQPRYRPPDAGAVAPGLGRGRSGAPRLPGAAPGGHGRRGARAFARWAQR